MDQTWNERNASEDQRQTTMDSDRPQWDNTQYQERLKTRKERTWTETVKYNNQNTNKTTSIAYTVFFKGSTASPHGLYDWSSSSDSSLPSLVLIWRSTFLDWGSFTNVCCRVSLPSISRGRATLLLQQKPSRGSSASTRCCCRPTFDWTDLRLLLAYMYKQYRLVAESGCEHCHWLESYHSFAQSSPVT